jgi:development and cellular proliferation protein Cullin-7
MAGKSLHLVLMLGLAVVAGSSPGQPKADPKADKKNESPKPPPNMFKSRLFFKTDAEYGMYVKETLQVGWRVRASVDYERVKKDMVGSYMGTNNGSPPCLIMWEKNIGSSSTLLPSVPKDKAQHIYWVQWYHVEILGP